MIIPWSARKQTKFTKNCSTLYLNFEVLMYRYTAAQLLPSGTVVICTLGACSEMCNTLLSPRLAEMGLGK